MDDTLKTQYGLNAGLNHIGLGKQVWEWIRDGGAFEDRPSRRALNHFHNPLRPWPEAGGILGQSSIYWQQNPNQSPGGVWSWPFARRRFFDFLTLPTQSKRDAALADAARALGQMMHMVQDAASPPHTRNDAHLVFDGYEARVEELRTGVRGPLDRERFLRYLSAPSVLPSSSIFTPTGDARAPVPVARLIDRDTYAGTVASYSNGNSIGIAEYTNGGYVSDDTIFLDFALPRRASLGPRFCEPGGAVPPCPPGSRVYFPKAGDGDGVGHFVAEGTLAERLRFRGQFAGGFILDDRVYDDYAERLLPRAVGYSAALLDYFFRGQLEVAFGEAPMDPARVLLNVTNRSAEPLGPGTLTVYAGDASGDRQPVPGATLTLATAVAPGELLPPMPLAASLQSSPLVVVYHGRLGGEDEAVIGRVLTPPTVVEQFFRGGGDWMLRTAEGIFPLGLGLGVHEVKWGERDNALLTQTFLFGDTGSDMALAAYRINRPEGSSAVPLTPEGRVDLVPIGSASLTGPAIDLQTTFSIQRHETLNQRLVVVNRLWHSNTLPSTVDYSLDKVLTRDLGDFPFSKAFPLVMRRPDPGNENYGWWAPRVFLTRAGDILAVIQVAPFGLLSEEIACWRHAGEPGTLVLVGGRNPGCAFFASHDLPLPLALGAIPFVVNLSRRSLVAKSTADAVAVTYSTDRDLWSVDVHNFTPDGTPNFWQWVNGFGIGLNAGGPVADEFAIADRIVELTLAGFHRQEFVNVGFAERALVEGPSTRVVPILPANISISPGLSLRVTTQRRFSCPDTTVIEDVDTAGGTAGEYIAIGKTLCGFDAPTRYTPVRWSPASGSATRFASFELPPNAFVTLTGANGAAAMVLAEGSGIQTYLATPTQALVFPGDLSSEHRLLDSGVLLNVQTFQVHSLDAGLTPIRTLKPLAAGGPLEGEYHLVGAP